ncbi:MAG: hypothetical protein ABJD24_05745 [Acidimicrobiales bacterium]
MPWSGSAARTIVSVQAKTSSPVGLGDADDVADHVHRERVRDVAHEVYVPLLRGGVEHLAGALGDEVVESGDHPRCDAGAHEPADPSVGRRIGR